MFNINITYWNINNYKSKQFGNKLLDPDFISACQSSHIVALGETHTTTADELTIPGFGKPYLGRYELIIRFSSEKFLRKGRTDGLYFGPPFPTGRVL